VLLKSKAKAKRVSDVKKLKQHVFLKLNAKTKRVSDVKQLKQHVLLKLKLKKQHVFLILNSLINLCY